MRAMREAQKTISGIVGLESPREWETGPPAHLFAPRLVLLAPSSCTGEIKIPPENRRFWFT